MNKVTCLLLTICFFSVYNISHAVSGSEKYLNSIDMVQVPGGCFQMGPAVGNEEESPAHEVCLDDFNIGRYEVTQGLWTAVMGYNPSYFLASSDHPVDMVSWQDTQLFLKKLNDITGKSYRLPTEAEWEYACLSGGKDELFCGSNNPQEIAWFDDHGGRNTKKVGTKKPNEFGIYDMSGNVEEWVQDLFSYNYYASSPKNNPQGPVEDSESTKGYGIRGGEWHCGERVLLARKRHAGRDNRENDRGFRLVHPVE